MTDDEGLVERVAAAIWNNLAGYNSWKQFSLTAKNFPNGEVAEKIFHVRSAARAAIAAILGGTK